ncbi:MAG: pyruvate dehydrogenase complex dihydrolipoamide acetyltransferase [Sphingomonadales bacterium]
MTVDVRMPALSPTMEEGTLAQWLVKEGDAISPGDIIAEIETDKATMEVEAVDEGRMGRILVPDGTEGVAVGSLIAVILEEGEDVSDIKATSTDIKPPVMPEPPPDPEPEPEATAPKQATAAPEPKPVAAAPIQPLTSDHRIKASPLARRLAAEAGLDLASIQGSGPKGRIIRRDIEGVGPATPGKPASTVAAVTGPDILPPPSGVPMTTERLSMMRKTIARRLSEAKRTVPHFYLTIDVGIDRLLKLRKELNADLPEGKVSLNDFVIKAVALALMKVPEANVQFGGDVIYRFGRADISVAVAIEGGLVTPIVRDAAAKSVVRISAEMKELAEKAREGRLEPEDYQGGTFSISNLGMFGIREFAAVINPPQAGILAVGKGEERPVVRHGAVQTATLMTVTLSCDHRAVDGAIGARFLDAFKTYLEAPLTMLV